MKTLLINGCSFGECWTPSADFVKNLGCDNVTNISKVATSFQRTCRTTLEWIAQNSDPTFVIILITFSHRWELAVSDEEDDLDGSWFPIQKKELIDSVNLNLHQDVSKVKLKQLVDLYYGSIPTIKTYWDKLFTEIILLASFLENRKIKCLFFDMCNEFDEKHIKGYKGFEKLKMINANKNIIDLFGFCGNRYMWSTMKNKEQIDFNTHHAPEQYLQLEKYILDYISH
jgi:hypothetical protein